MSIVEERINIINKKYGKKKLISFSDESLIDEQIELIPSGSLYLDYALGGGYVKGCVAEITALDSVGKTTHAIHVVKEALTKYPDEIAVYMDVEHRLNKKYANYILGDARDRALISQPDCGDECCDIIEDTIRMDKVAVCVVDSVAALIPRAELEEGSKQRGSRASLVGNYLNRLEKLVPKTNTLLMLINQFRVTNMSGYGNPIGHMGGFSIPYFSSIRVEMKRENKPIIYNDTPYGQIIHAEVIKNSYASPFRKATFYLIYGTGISKEDEIFDISLENGEIDKNGSWFSIKDHKLGQGKLNALETIKQDKELFTRLEKSAKEFLFSRKN